MGLFFNRRPKVVVNVVVQQPEQPEPMRPAIQLSNQQRKLLRQGAVMDSEGNFYVKGTIWIPNELRNRIYHAKDFCGGRQCGTPYIEGEAVRRGLKRCPYCFQTTRTKCIPTDRPYKPCTPIDRAEKVWSK